MTSQDKPITTAASRRDLNLNPKVRELRVLKCIRRASMGAVPLEALKQSPPFVRFAICLVGHAEPASGWLECDAGVA